jgi:hypothetical protein
MRKWAALALLALSACAGAPPPAPVGEACRGDGLSSFAGQPATQELGAAMLRTSGARTIRWVAQGMMVTMDYSPQRLTVYLTADNRVERASCG